MQKHEYFRELSALAAIGQLSAEEHRELSEHLRACERCRRAGDQYEFILDQLPLPEPSATSADFQQLHSNSYRQRFFDRALSQGLRFTREAVEAKKRPWLAFTHWRPFAFGTATAVAAMLLVGSILIPRLSRQRITGSVATSRQPAVAEVAPAITAAAPIDTSADDLARLEKANRSAEERLGVLRQELAQAKADRERLVGELEEWKDQASRFRAEDEQSKQQLGSVKSAADKLGREREDLEAILVAQQIKIQELSGQVQTQTAAVERERQLTAVARDVRDMMGARNLHIIDVADLDWRGKSKKSFGRVFYAEGRSLIFYAFDLSEKSSASKVSFQAWGQTPSGGPKVKNLGVFRLDDQAQKRWVLRVDDPVLLGSIESLFVTVEPAPGRDRPTGQKLLYAYLGTPANHP